MRAERHLVEIVAVRVLAQVRGTNSADAALARFIQSVDSGDDGELAGAIIDRSQLCAKRLDRPAELFVRRLQIAVLVAKLRELVGLGQRCEVLDREEAREAEGGGNQGEDREEQTVRDLH